MENIKTTCCIAGGGPAGMMAGLLLARAGIEVVVLEKHADFLRDFRGDTVHPSTLEAIYELGFLEEFLKLPHQKVSQLVAVAGNREVTIADFSRLNVHEPYVAFMPQWDFLNFLAKQASIYKNFKLIMQAEVKELKKDGGRITGLKARTPEGEIEIDSTIVLGADGRHSRVRELAGLKVKDYGVPIDVLWFRLPRIAGDTSQALARFLPGSIMIMLNRDDYWQCGYVIQKGRFDVIKREGLAEFHKKISSNAPFITDRINKINDWEEIKLLTVKIDRLEQWYMPGLLCIGDSAHAMSPVGGVGINLAIQDAIAAANILKEPLHHATLTEKHLAEIQKRRLWPVKMTQNMQVFMHKNVIDVTMKGNKEFKGPLPFRIVGALPFLRRITAYIIGIGVRPEHIK